MGKGDMKAFCPWSVFQCQLYLHNPESLPVCGEHGEECRRLPALARPGWSWGLPLGQVPRWSATRLPPRSVIRVEVSRGNETFPTLLLIHVVLFIYFEDVCVMKHAPDFSDWRRSFRKCVSVWPYPMLTWDVSLAEQRWVGSWSLLSRDSLFSPNDSNSRKTEEDPWAGSFQNRVRVGHLWLGSMWVAARPRPSCPVLSPPWTRDGSPRAHFLTWLHPSLPVSTAYCCHTCVWGPFMICLHYFSFRNVLGFFFFFFFFTVFVVHTGLNTVWTHYNSSKSPEAFIYFFFFTFFFFRSL